MITNQDFYKPPKTTNTDGKERQVGFEFEFTGVEMENVASMITSLYGGEITQFSTYKFEIKNTEFGDFDLELDAQLIREKKYEKFLSSIGIDLSIFENIEPLEDSLKELASSVVPYEIITPPVVLSEIYRFTSLVNELRKRKAKGTGSSFIYAFGLHINPEIADASTESLLNHLRAFVMLDSWIRKEAEIDVSRRVTPFINPFEEDYIRHILNPAYQPSLKEFIEDYFSFGNTRNRALDMLPLFMYLDERLTSTLIEDALTKARPTYHYRLPNCSLEDESWTLSDEWNRWVLVEKLADNQKVLNKLSEAYLKMREEKVMRFEAKWLNLIDIWIQNEYEK